MQHPPYPHTVTGSPRGRGATHAARPALDHRRVVVGALGASAVLAALGLGAAACLTTLGPSTSTPTSAGSITVTPSATRTGSGPENTVPTSSP